jgi:hypothetical protein
MRQRGTLLLVGEDYKPEPLPLAEDQNDSFFMLIGLRMEDGSVEFFPTYFDHWEDKTMVLSGTYHAERESKAVGADLYNPSRELLMTMQRFAAIRMVSGDAMKLTHKAVLTG